MKKILIACFALILMMFAGFASALDLNSATAAELAGLKGIGPVKSKAITDYRDKNGPFKSVDDLKSVKGFSAKTIDKLRPELTVGGAAPVPAAVPAPKAAAPAPVVAPPKSTVTPNPAPAKAKTSG